MIRRSWHVELSAQKPTLLGNTNEFQGNRYSVDNNAS